MIDYSGIDEAELIHGLYHRTGRLGLDTPAGIIDRMHGGDRVTIEVVRADLEKVYATEPRGGFYLDYYRGRPLKVHLNTVEKTFEERLYDRDAGAGAAASVVAELRASRSV